LQEVHDLKPDALFVFVPAGADTALLKQFAERGLDKAGIKLIGEGMHVIYQAIRATRGQGDGAALVAAMKGQIFESPRGPIYIHAQTRDIVQNVYIRRGGRVNGQLYNVEFDTLRDVKDPGKSGK
jgi:hypothetical protein